MGKIIELNTNKKQENIVLEDTSYCFLADYSARELYINVKFEDKDINVDVGVNIDILTHFYTNNWKVNKRSLSNFLGVSEKYIIAIYRAYIEFGLIDFIGNVCLPETILDKYIEKRLEIGYPRDRRKFSKVQKLEKEVFSKKGYGVDKISEDLYFRANKY